MDEFYEQQRTSQARFEKRIKEVSSKIGTILGSIEIGTMLNDIFLDYFPKIDDSLGHKFKFDWEYRNPKCIYCGLLLPTDDKGFSIRPSYPSCPSLLELVDK